jgi:hypothetical protein
MKRILLIAIVVLAFASAASAVTPIVAFFSDAAGTQCNHVELTGAFQQNTAYIVAIADAHTAVEYKAPLPACLASEPGASVTPQGGTVIIGDVNTGVSIGYGVCKTGAWAVGKVQWFHNTGVAACCKFFIYEHPATGHHMADCGLPTPGKFEYVFDNNNTINGDGSCDCSTSPVAESTWGKIKATYAN